MDIWCDVCDECVFQRLNVEMVRRAERQMQDLKGVIRLSLNLTPSIPLVIPAPLVTLILTPFSVKAAERHERKLFLLKMFDTHKVMRS